MMLELDVLMFANAFWLPLLLLRSVATAVPLNRRGIPCLNPPTFRNGSLLLYFSYTACCLCYFSHDVVFCRPVVVVVDQSRRIHLV